MTTLVLGPSLGTSADACWGPAADLLRDDLEIVTWELPGHGHDHDPAPAGLTVADLASRVLDGVNGDFVYAGDSVGGQVGLQVLLDAPDRVLGAVLCCTGAKIGDDAMWDDRTAQVRASGTASLVEDSASRWFAPGFLERQPGRASALLHALRDATDNGYLAAVHAVSTCDLRDRLAEIDQPVVAVAGRHDPVCPPDLLREIADGVQRGRLVVIDDVAHQAPAEAPEQVAAIVRELVLEVTA